MSLGLIGRKVGMTHVYNEDGAAIPVTVIDVSQNDFLQVKNSETDGYSAVQVGFDEQKESRVNQPKMGHFRKHGSKPKRVVKEFRFADDESVPDPSSTLDASLFQNGQYVDVIGVTKGKGFQGVMKRYNYGGLPMTHGSMMHRRTGGIAMGTDPGRVWKGKEMPGHHGVYRRTVQNLQVVESRPEDNVLLISGAVPGPKGGIIVVRPAKKKPLPEAK
ncbi:MAG: large subunit ribosomal protein L3 [Verrucomicrobiales bacterium]|jgi:large subunit ribosomal protein L3